MTRVFVPMATLKLTEQTIAPLDFARETYTKKLLHYGMAPVFVSHLFPRELVDELYKECRGVLCMGGTDFEPVTYGAERHTATDAKESPRDALELYVIRKALADKKPFLGICRGCQALAIAGGGTLHQHLAEIAPDEKHDAGKDGIYDDLAAQEGHKVFIAPGTKAHTLLKKDAIITNSGHHQGIRTVGDNFVISGTTKGGVVEIIEHAAKDFFCFGIQAHPEAQEEGDCEPFFKAFAEACEKT